MRVNTSFVIAGGGGKQAFAKGRKKLRLVPQQEGEEQSGGEGVERENHGT